MPVTEIRCALAHSPRFENVMSGKISQEAYCRCERCGARTQFSNRTSHENAARGARLRAFLPAEARHFAWTKTRATVQGITENGPVVLNYVNPVGRPSQSTVTK